MKAQFRLSDLIPPRLVVESVREKADAIVVSERWPSLVTYLKLTLGCGNVLRNSSLP